MARNGSGSYNLPTNSWSPAINGVPATAADWQALINDVASAITQSLSRDGQTAVTGNLQMAGNKLTGLGLGTASGDSLPWQQLFSQGLQQDLASASVTDIGAVNSTLVNVTGTTTITSFGTNYNGPRFLRFAGVLTLTNSITLDLPGNANITTAAGDSAIAAPLGNPATGWRVISYVREADVPGVPADKSVTFAKIQNVATSTILGRSTAGTGDVEALTGAQATGVLTGAVGQIAGFRNMLINGNYQVNQRAYVSGTATAGANQYTLDRWRVVTSGQNLTFTASGNGNQITAPAGGVEQVIEGINIGGGTYVLNWTGTATATVNGTARTKGESFTLPANTNATVRLTGGTASLVQLEPGTTPTPFEHRPIGAELALCQRYFHNQNSGVVGAWMAGLPGWVTNGVSHPVTMRAAPTVTQPTSFTIQGVTASATGFAITANAFTYSYASANANGIGDGVCRAVAPNNGFSFSAEL